MDGAAASRQILQAGASQSNWACPSGVNITGATRATIAAAQPCVAAVGFPGRLRCGDVLANPSVVLDVRFNLCKRISKVRAKPRPL